jgi:hypothetical protein
VSRGGARPGAGRKKGSVTKATELRQEMLARAAAEGISPLEVMMQAMREAWAANDHEKAVEYAVSAAPYVHPRLSAVKHSGDENQPVAMTVTHSDADTFASRVASLIARGGEEPRDSVTEH